ncbi:MAG: hypothetical protein RBR54_06020 [Sulfurimonas sp.]|jgi:hypothetical protein|nr:hypothetical protein [Sulfurimonas sp.]
MSFISYYSRGFSLPEQFCTKYAKELNQKNQQEVLLSTFDNNRYASRGRMKTFSLKSFEAILFTHKVTIELRAMLHISNNLVIIAAIKSDEKLSTEELKRLNDNWIPTENIFSYNNTSVHIRNILNYGLASFLTQVLQKELSFSDFLTLQSAQTMQYEDKDIQEIEKIYGYFAIDYKEIYIIPTMYGNTSFFLEDDSLFDLELEKFFLDKESFYIQRNFAYIFSKRELQEKYVYFFAFFNLLRHMKNRLNSEISYMLDSLADKDADYTLFLEKATEIKKEYALHYDEFNNINIWHDNELFELSKYLRSDKGWNIEAELIESKNKLHEFIELTTEMSKGKLQTFMDSISILIGILGIFAIFDLVQILTEEPYKVLPWYLTFIVIIFLLPFLFVIIAKKSNTVIRFINKYL